MTLYNVFSADDELLHTAEHASADFAVMAHNMICDCDLAVYAERAVRGRARGQGDDA
jgi:hypothetical protein